MNLQKRLQAFTGLCMTVVMFFHTSCINEIKDDTLAKGTVPITFRARLETDAETRVTDNSFDAGDQIGLFATLASDDSYLFFDNLLLQCGTGGSLSASEEIFYPEGDAALNFYGYYPYQKTAVGRELSVSVQADQSTDAAYSASDFLATVKEGVAASTNPVELVFRHCFFRLQLVLKPEGGVEATDVLEADPKVTVVGFGTRATYDLSTATLSDVQGESYLTPHGTWKEQSGNLVGKEVILIPQTVTETVQVVLLEWNGRVYTCPLPEFEMEGGQQRTLTISLVPTDNTLEGIMGSIEPWVEGEALTSENAQLNSAIHLAALSFDASSVYRVYRNGAPVAEVCKEYLSTPGRQAIVAYPMTGGTVDLQAGTVLQLLGETEAVHGGKVSWNEADGTLSYTAGDQAPVERFYIADDNSVSLTLPGSPAQVAITAYTLTDLRGTERHVYPVVKVGTQYWMADNLRATRLPDGTAIDKSTDLTADPVYYYDPTFDAYFYGGTLLVENRMAPAGWRIPTDSDWETLQTYVGDDASLLKAGTWEIYTTDEPVQPATNQTGFNLLPEGFWSGGGYMNDNRAAGFWTQESDGTIPETLISFFNSSENTFVTSESKSSSDKTTYKGLSIRCIRQ